MDAQPHPAKGRRREDAILSSFGHSRVVQPKSCPIPGNAGTLPALSSSRCTLSAPQGICRRQRRCRGGRRPPSLRQHSTQVARRRLRWAHAARPYHSHIAHLKLHEEAVLLAPLIPLSKARHIQEPGAGRPEGFVSLRPSVLTGLLRSALRLLTALVTAASVHVVRVSLELLRGREIHPAIAALVILLLRHVPSTSLPPKVSTTLTAPGAGRPRPSTTLLPGLRAKGKA